MADLVPAMASELPGTVSQSSFPMAKDNTEDNTREKKVPPKASRQRFKPQLSCTFCRTRKPDPTSRGPSRGVDESSQKYNSAIGSEPAILPGFQSSTVKPRELSRPDNAAISEGADSIGRICVEDELQNYVGESHWAAILENIVGLKDSLGSEEWPQGTSRGNNTYKGPELLLGDNRTASRESILACLPSKALVDNLVERYFTAIDASFITHAPTFRNEHAEFWENPDSKSISWIGLLFSMICLAANFELRAGDAPIAELSVSVTRDTEQRIRIYREKTVQCLVNSNYTEPGLYTVGTLLLHYLSEHFQSKVTLFGSWMVFGMIVRAAMRLGLHRDASHNPNISVFRGEMQRRLWGTILLLDIQVSCQIGLPRMISEGMYDTKPANHLLDEDLFEDMVALPPARLEHESSPVGHALSKYRLLLVFGKIYDASNLITPINYDEVIRLEKLLFDALGEIPDFFRVRSIHDLDSGSLMLRVRRFTIEMTYRKARCFPQRKFLSEAESLQKHSYSVKACVDSSMLILQYQNYMNDETAHGHSLHGMKWIVSSLMTYDFLLAATLLCLYLGQLMAAKETSVGTSLQDFPIDWTIKDVLHVLSKSYQIWNNPDNSSEDTIKFSKVLKAMLSKVDHWSTVNKTQGEVAKEITKESNSNISLPEHQEVRFASIPHECHPPNYSALNLYSLQSSNSEESPGDSSASNIGMIGDILNDPTGLDWSLWDSNFQGSSNYIDAEASLYPSDSYFPFQAAGFKSNLDGS